MARQVFTWFPDVGNELEEEPATNQIKFGDGYELRVQNALNTTPQKWSLSFSRNASVSREILMFLRLHGGKNAFTWTSPLREEGVYVCRRWKARREEGGMVVTCTFEQVFES